MSDCRIILVDDHTLFRGGLRGLLDRYEGFRVVGEAGSGEELLERIGEWQADVVFMDIAMPGMGGAEATQFFTVRHPADQRTHEIPLFRFDLPGLEQVRIAKQNQAPGSLVLVHVPGIPPDEGRADPPFPSRSFFILFAVLLFKSLAQSLRELVGA